MQRRILAPFLICALLALPGCGIVKGVVKRTVVRVVSGSIAAALGLGADDAAAEDEEFYEEDDTSYAEDESGWAGEEEAAEGESGGSGFYKVVEANGTVRFVSNLSEVPPSQRPNAERLAMERSNDPAKPKRRAAPKAATKQLAAAKSSAPSAGANSSSD